MPQEPLKICRNCGRKYMTSEDFLKNTSRWRICDEGHLWFNCDCLSTGMIVKGRFPWYDPKAKLSLQAQSIFNRLPQLKELPHVPSYVMRVQVLLENENTSSQQLADVTKNDPLLAAQILEVANQRGSAARIDSLAHAISFVGIEHFKDFILMAAISSFELKTTLFKADRFWEQSFLIGRCAEFLVKRFKLPFSADRAYIGGSSCNIGKIVLAICMPDLADHYMKDLTNLKILGSWTQAENRHGAYQHTVLGEIGAMFWGLPEAICDGISLHHRMPSPTSTTPPSFFELIALANQLSHWLALQPHEMDQPLFQALCDRFKISPRDVEPLIMEMQQVGLHAA